MFNLDNAINEWLRLFRKHRAFNHASIREMELHLRDHIDDLMADGHKEKDAFEIAVKEFGEIPKVAKEEFKNLQLRRNSRPVAYFALLRNYITIALRSFTNQPFFTFLNTFGLATGMAGVLLISLFILDELSFDTMFADADHIYRINIDNRTNGEDSHYAAAPGPIAAVLSQDCPAVAQVTRFRTIGSTLMREPNASLNVKEEHVTAVDSSFFSMFGFALLEGNERTALKDPNTLVITRAVAKKHFGAERALGRNLLLNNKDLYLITGVIDDLPKNSFLRNHQVFIALESYEDAKTTAWNTWYFPTFVKLKPHTQAQDLQTFLDDVKERYLIPWAMTFVPGLTIESSRAADNETGDFMRFNATALPDIHLFSTDRRQEFSPNSDIENVYIMLFIGLFLIVLAIVNYMNLSTAYSLRRAKEVGIRKTVGSSRLGLVRQFLTESTMISFLSIAVGILMSMLVLPLFNQLSDKQISLPLASPVFWMVTVAVGCLLGLLSGGYPAFFISRFTPVEVLKGGQATLAGSRLRDYLVVFQFAIAVFLIISTIVVFQQVNFIRNKDLGFQKDQILVIDDVEAAGNHVESFKETVKQMPNVAGVSLSSYLPTPSIRGGTTYFQEGALEGGFKSEGAMIIQEWGIDYNYIPTLDLQIIAGRNFDPQFGTDSSALVLNESAVAMIGVTPEKVIGMRLTSDFHRQDKENMQYLTVIGVVRNFHFESLRSNIDALSLRFSGTGNKMMVRLTAGNFPDAVGKIEKTWLKMAPGQPFSYYFMDKSFQDTYKAELRLGNIFMTFSLLSIFIACLGLFGLAAYNAERRSKEIGIKKVLGATVNQITYQLSINFLKLVAVAIFISTPLSWYAMHRWLEEYSFRIELGWGVFLLAAIIATAISVLTVSYQSIKAALANPVHSLRSE